MGPRSQGQYYFSVLERAISVSERASAEPHRQSSLALCNLNQILFIARIWLLENLESWNQGDPRRAAPHFVFCTGSSLPAKEDTTLEGLQSWAMGCSFDPTQTSLEQKRNFMFHRFAFILAVFTLAIAPLQAGTIHEVFNQTYTGTTALATILIC